MESSTPKKLPPKIKMDTASRVPRFPGAMDGKNVTIPNKTLTKTIT